MSPSTLIATVASELALSPSQVGGALALFGEGNTLPFIARYRKEATGGLDEVQLRDVRDRAQYLTELHERRTAILAEIASQGKLDDALAAKIGAAETKQALEDLYLPFKPKRRTRAMIARERGLEPLGDLLLGRATSDDALEAAAAAYVDAEKGVSDVAHALAGARDIVAEHVAEDAQVRGMIRDLTRAEGSVTSRVVSEKASEVSKFQDYYDFSQKLGEMPSHRILAIRRGEAEGFLISGLVAPAEKIAARLDATFVHGHAAPRQMTLAVQDAYKRLIAPGVELDLRLEMKTRADEEAIAIFGQNLEQLLLSAPAGERVVIGLDPGFRTGVKVAAVSRTGALLATDTWYLHQPERFAASLLALASRLDADLIAIGNGTASRETEQLTRETLRAFRPAAVSRPRHPGESGRHPRESGDPSSAHLGSRLRGNDGPDAALRPPRESGRHPRESGRHPRESGDPLDPTPAIAPQVVVVSESGASVYSASDLAREEFPELDVSLRGAVSIARRLQDPLAELVKIDPKAIGVGQYQHDVNQPRLKQRLDDVVESCVNRVGVELNTASVPLLSYVAGIGPTLAQNIVRVRDERGGIRSRKELLDVPRLGAKAFEQAAGFLRVRGGAHPLDATAVHPERYALVERIARDLGVALDAMLRNEQAIERIDTARYVADGVGMPTLVDILSELRKPGRDPRETFEPPAFRADLTSPKDLSEGMMLEGVVTNIVAFGCFVDVGVHQDGLVHVSQLADRFVRDPNDVVKVGQKVKVRVVSVDLERNRIALSMKSDTGAASLATPASAPRGAKRHAPPRPDAAAGGKRGSAPFVPASGTIAPNGMRFK